MGNNDELYQKDKELISNALKLRFFPLNVVYAKGCMLYDAEGKAYIDMNAGWAVMNLGYGHPIINNAIKEAVERVSFVSLASTLTKESVNLAEQLTELMPGDFPKKVWFGHSGSDANEFLSKMLPVATGRKKIITFVGSYHGQSMGAYGLSGHPALMDFQKEDSDVIKIPYPYCYRCPCGKQQGECDNECFELIHKTILACGCKAEDVAAVIMEAAQSDGGDVPAPVEYIKKLDDFCKKNGIYLIFDEVKIGFGRSGKWFGFQYADVIPDAVVLGKPLGEGQPISAVVGRKELMDAGTGTHLFTTAGNPVACQAALATIDVIKKENIMSNVQVVSKILQEELLRLQKKYDVIGDVRAFGLLIGIEMVKDRITRTPAPELAACIIYRAYELGVVFYVTGIDSNVLELTPPLIISEEEAKRVIEVIDEAMDDALNGRVDEKKVAEFAGWAC